MPKYQIQMIETRTYDVLYVVEADTAEQAEKKALNGDTLSETDVKIREVVNRDSWGCAELIKDDK